MKIGIAGVGGIGSNIAVNLVRSGIKKIKYGDFDRVEKSNLNRQFYFKDQIGMLKIDALYENLRRIDENIEVEKKEIKFNKENIKEYFQDCDIVVEGFDSKESKCIFMEEFYKSGKLIVSASGIAGIDTEKIKVKKLGENVYVVGDFEKDIKEYKVMSHKVACVAAKMTEIIMEFLLKKE